MGRALSWTPTTEDSVGTSSDCSVCAFMVKKEKAANGLVNTLCNTSGDENENPSITWVGSDIKINLEGTLDNNTDSESKFKLKLLGHEEIKIYFFILMEESRNKFVNSVSQSDDKYR